jgi:outer membrane protein TolC
VEIAQLRYREGITDFLSLLDAQRSLLEAEDGLTQTETQSYTALIAVYKSLGGGWEVAEPPPAADAQSRESRGSGG